MTAAPTRPPVPTVATCPSCRADMPVVAVAPVLSGKDDSHTADEVTYRCPKCGTEVRRTFPAPRNL